MASANDWTSVSPATNEGFLVQAETTVRVGSLRYYGSLEISSATYNATYDYASQGLQSAQAVNFGLLEGISIELTAEFEDLPATNVISSGVKSLSAEGATVSMTVKQYEPDIIDFMIQNGTLQNIYSGAEYLLRYGGACTTKSRPLELSVVNLACQSPVSQGLSVDIANGLTGMVFTIYDGQFTSGLNWGDITAAGFNAFEATYEATPWLARELGNRLGNILLF